MRTPRTSPTGSGRAGRRSPPTRRRELRTRLLRLPQYAPRPPHLWLLVLAFALSGLVLLAIAADADLSRAPQRSRRNVRDRICCTFARLRPRHLGDLRAAEIAAEAQAQQLLFTSVEAPDSLGEVRVEPKRRQSPRSSQRLLGRMLQRLLGRGLPGAVVVDQEVARDREQPGVRRRSPRS